MIQSIPFTNDPYQELVVDWKGNSLEFIVFWNDQASCWFFNLNDYISGTTLANGIALVPGTDLLKPLALDIEGSLFINDENNTGSNPTQDGLGTDFMVYLTDEL